MVCGFGTEVLEKFVVGRVFSHRLTKNSGQTEFLPMLLTRVSAWGSLLMYSVVDVA